MTDKKIKGKLRCDDCIANESLFHKKKCKSEWGIVVSRFFIN